jgi:hypothetical protein
MANQTTPQGPDPLRFHEGQEDGRVNMTKQQYVGLVMCGSFNGAIVGFLLGVLAVSRGFPTPPPPLLFPIGLLVMAGLHWLAREIYRRSQPKLM